MAKKKKVNSQLPFYLTIGILVVAILGVVLFLFLDAVTLKEVESTGIGIFDDLIGEIQDKLAEHTKFNGMQIVFGYSETYAEGSILESTLNILNFSFVALIPLILVVAGIVLNIPKSKLLSLIGVVCFVAAAVMLIFVPNYVSIAGSDSLGAADYYQPAVGAYLGMVCSAICAILGLGRTLLIK